MVRLITGTYEQINEILDWVTPDDTKKIVDGLKTAKTIDERINFYF